MSVPGVVCVPAAALVGYLAVGRTLRQWMPIFVYAFPVTALAALELTLVALVVGV